MTEPAQIYRILIVAGDPNARAELRGRLTGAGYVVDEASRGVDLLEVLKNEAARPFDLIVLDPELPDGNGLEYARHVRRQTAVPIVVTAADPRVARSAAGLLAVDCVDSPVGEDPDGLMFRIARMLHGDHVMDIPAGPAAPAAPAARSPSIVARYPVLTGAAAALVLMVTFAGGWLAATRAPDEAMEPAAVWPPKAAREAEAKAPVPAASARQVAAAMAIDKAASARPARPIPPTPAADAAAPVAGKDVVTVGGDLTAALENALAPTDPASSTADGAAKASRGASKTIVRGAEPRYKAPGVTWTHRQDTVAADRDGQGFAGFETAAGETTAARLRKFAKVKEKCGVMPSVKWWKNNTIEDVHRYIRYRADGDWNRYIETWSKREKRLEAIYNDGKKIVIKSEDLILGGEKLRDYIEVMKKRVAYLKCAAEIMQ